MIVSKARILGGMSAIIPTDSLKKLTYWRIENSSIPQSVSRSIDQSADNSSTLPHKKETRRPPLSGRRGQQFAFLALFYRLFSFFYRKTTNNNQEACMMCFNLSGSNLQLLMSIREGLSIAIRYAEASEKQMAFLVGGGMGWDDNALVQSSKWVLNRNQVTSGRVPGYVIDFIQK